MQPRQYPFFIITLAVIIIVGLYFVKVAFSVPDHFPVGKNFVVDENESLKSISYRLESEGYITSPILFRAGASFLHRDTKIQVGGYVFDHPHTFLGVLHKLIQGKPDVPLLSVTIPEGSTNEEIIHLVTQALPTTDGTAFLSSVSKHDAYGMLFPSTYFLLPSYKEDDVVRLMKDTFDAKTSELFSGAVYTKELPDERSILSLAAILEGEAKTKEDMALVAGILIARLHKGMALQVDAAKETYTKKGLPLIPIDNPGLVAIEAALHPTPSQYLYYITGTDGKMYYAKTFEEHKSNIRKYLRN